jgi:hypothetical protein
MGLEAERVLDIRKNMKKELTTQVGPDGLLNLAVPLGQTGANKTVHVVVETVEEPMDCPTISQEEWTRFVHRMAGRITDPTFGRQPQGDYENREAFP